MHVLHSKLWPLLLFHPDVKFVVTTQVLKIWVPTTPWLLKNQVISHIGWGGSDWCLYLKVPIRKRFNIKLDFQVKFYIESFSLTPKKKKKKKEEEEEEEDLTFGKSSFKE